MISYLSAKNVYDIWASECECMEVLDFRSISSIQSSRIPGTNNLSPKDISIKTFLEDQNKVFVLIEAPAELVSEVSKHSEVDNVFIIDGGLGSWVDAGYPLAPLVIEKGRSQNV
ncbi:hypothetical protein GW916_02015 [bacterium]|nr:hypothetical protein [bacterium]